MKNVRLFCSVLNIKPLKTSLFLNFAIEKIFYIKMLGSALKLLLQYSYSEQRSWRLDSKLFIQNEKIVWHTESNVAYKNLHVNADEIP